MNILFITAQPCTPEMFGGLQSSANELGLFLQQRGHHVSLLCALIGKGAFGLKTRALLKIKRQPAVQDNVIGFPAWRSWFPWEALPWVAGQVSPDLAIVLARQPVRMALAAKQAGIPVLMMLQDVEFKDHGGDFSLLGKVPCVANSQFTANRYRKAFGVEPVVIPPLINGAEKYATPTTRENITFINPHPCKGLETALAVARRCPEIPFSFVKGWPMASDGWKALEERFSSAPNVTLRPSEKDMRKVYGRCKILLAPSTWEEAYGRVATEAQFSGIPVIASNRGGLPEAVGPGGILLEPDVIDDWVIAVRKLWQDSAHYASLSKAALDYASRPALKWHMQADLWEKSFQQAVRH